LNKQAVVENQIMDLLFVEPCEFSYLTSRFAVVERK
jgi:hypothetical protein